MLSQSVRTAVPAATVTLTVATATASAGNYLLNVVLGRWLTVREFGDATLMVTMMLLVTAAALCLQLVAARHTARAAATGDARRAGSVRRQLHRWAWSAGLVLAVSGVLGAPALSRLLQTAEPTPFVVLAAGLPLYLVQSVDRGVLQGQLRLAGLAATYVVEAAVRLGAAVALVAAGLGVLGATAAIALSFAASWLVARRLVGPGPAAPSEVDNRDLLATTRDVGVLLVGQIVINNSDVVLAKHVLDPADAGLYAAVALTGRAVFFLSWAVATGLFPLAAQSEGDPSAQRRVLVGGVAATTVMCAAMTSLAWPAGPWGLALLLGDAYRSVGHLVGPYALATSLFTVANVVATVDCSVRRRDTSWAVVAAGGLQVLALSWFAVGLAGFVIVQIAVMSLLLATVTLLHLLRAPAQAGTRPAAHVLDSTSVATAARP